MSSLKWRTLFSAIITLFGITTVAVADSSKAPISIPEYSFGLISEDKLPWTSNSLSYIAGYTLPTKQNNNASSTRNCLSLTDSHCDSVHIVEAHLVLPPCHSVTERMCVEGLELGIAGGILEKASLDHEVLTLATPADIKSGLPAGSGVGLWKSNSIENTSGAFNYGVGVEVTYVQRRITDDNQKSLPKEKWSPLVVSRFDASIVPVKMVNGEFSGLEIVEIVFPGTGQNVTTARQKIEGSADESECYWTEQNLCAQYADFVVNTRAALTIRMNNNLTGWLSGRMRGVEISVNPIDSKNNLLRVEGTTVDIPSATGFIFKSDISKHPAIEKLARDAVGQDQYASWLTNSASLYSIANREDHFLAWEQFLKPRASRNSRWSMNGSFVFTSNGIVHGCFADKTRLLGLVTTNAMNYSEGPPTFDGDSLSYKVAGLHNLADGTLFAGTYDLSMRSDVARCLYGFTDAPLKAVVSVTSADGRNQDIQTESLSEKKGWLHLGAYNFHFSQPTVRVKLTQASKPSLKSIPKVTITCTKGKTTKKVLGVNPKCPPGFK